jgi:hypothetical protein
MRECARLVLQSHAWFGPRPLPSRKVAVQASSSMGVKPGISPDAVFLTITLAVADLAGSGQYLEY